MVRPRDWKPIRCWEEPEIVFADGGYTGAEKRPELQHRWDLNWQIAERRSSIKALREDNSVRLEAEAIERRKASFRAPVEHAFHVLKCRFGYRKVRFRGTPRTNRNSLRGSARERGAGR